MNLLEGQIPPLRNSSSRSRYSGRNDKTGEVVTPVGMTKQTPFVIPIERMPGANNTHFVIPIERTPGANRGICFRFFNKFTIL